MTESTTPVIAGRVFDARVRCYFDHCSLLHSTVHTRCATVVVVVVVCLLFVVVLVVLLLLY